LRAVREATAKGQKVRAAYVPDAELGTRWFADKSVWVRSPGERGGVDFVPFDTAAGAQRFTGSHPGATVVDYQAALAGAV
jgi:NitT/TauT family transport system substrate-binding protein